MHAIQEWVNNHLIEWGIISSSANELDNTIVLLLIIAVTVGIDYACRYIFLNMFKRLAKRTRHQWDDLIVERKIINKLMHMIPAILVYVLLPLAFPVDETPKILGILQMICKIYIIAVSLRFISASLNVVHEIYNRKESLKNKPLKGFIQLLQVAVFFIGFILIISILIGKSPTTLFAGLGASAAILMLVFKDTILGFVAGIQLSANDMLRPGDWITVPGSNANGIVQEITLNTVKIQNFDNTIVTIPPYSLISGEVQNWRGMSDSGGRRIMRSFTIDLNTVKFCTPELLQNLKQIDILRDFIEKKESQQQKGIVENTENSEGLVNGTIETNLGLFRAYMTLYLQQHKFINDQLTLMVRTLDPNDNGLPLQLYCFSANKNWVSYESIQAEIFEHYAAIMPRFGLYPFQNPSGRDYINSALLTAGHNPDELWGIPWGTMKEKNTEVPPSVKPEVSATPPPKPIPPIPPK